MTPCVAVWPKLAFWLGGNLKVGFKGIRYGVGGGRGVVVMLICTALASPSTSNICSELDQKKVDIDVIVQYIIIIR